MRPAGASIDDAPVPFPTTVPQKDGIMTRIDPKDVADHRIGDTDVTVADLLDLLVLTQDGRLDRDMEAEFGMQLGERVAAVRSQVMPIWKVMTTR